MIKEILIYKIVCDKCKKDSTEGTEYAGWTDISTALDVAFDADFKVIEDKHYCDDCFETIDEDDISY